MRLRRRSSADPIATWGGLALVITGSIGLYLLVTSAGLPWQPTLIVVTTFIAATIITAQR
jgi:hypothetical protein